MKIRLLPLLSLSGLLVSLPGCELFGLDDSELEINVPAFEMTVDIPLQSVPAEVPQGQTLEQWVGVPLKGAPPLSVNLLEQDSRLEKYDDKIQRIVIREITYEIEENELTADLPPFELHFGPHGMSTNLDDPTTASGVVKYGQTDPIRAGETLTTAKRIEPLPGATDKVADLMSGLSFSSLAGSHLVLTSGSPIPSGKLTLTVSIQVTVFVRPY